MTVAELIAELQKMPQDVRVCASDEWDFYADHVIDYVTFHKGHESNTLGRPNGRMIPDHVTIG